MKLTVGVVDYGVGNVASVRHAFQKLGHHVIVASREDWLSRADALILPGVGAFPAAMSEIRRLGLDRILPKLAVSEGKPILGICLGMQVLAEWGEEFGGCEGLGLIPGRVKKLPPAPGRKIPNVGWCEVEVKPEGAALFSRQAKGDAYYFDHSYFFDARPDYRIAHSKHDDTIVAAVGKGSVWGVQFHPEKSQNSGLRLLKAFCRMSAFPEMRA